MGSEIGVLTNEAITTTVMNVLLLMLDKIGSESGKTICT